MATRLLRETGLLGGLPRSSTLGEVFDCAFSMLRRPGVRNEYVYRSALTQNILLGRHSLTTASLLTEFRVGASKADLAILNGTSTVYEIKSDRDSLGRLSGQLKDYRTIFAKIYVIVGENHLDDLLASVSEDIGVLALARWNRIRTIREASDRSSEVSPLSIFESVRIAEAKDILKGLGCDVPDVPNTMMHAALKERFERLDARAVHDQMVKTLRKSRSLHSLSEHISDLPFSLQAMALSVRVRQADWARLRQAISSSINQVEQWA